MTKRLVLASQSPRRQALLQQLKLTFDCVNPNIAEQRHADEPIDAFAQRMAVEKAQAGAQQLNDSEAVVLGADTCGEIAGQLLAKPTDEADAKQLLQLLSGRTHRIYTAFALCQLNQPIYAEVVSSSVTFRQVSDEEITAYWQTGEPADKAGAYAIQGLGAQFVQHLSGSYSAVMGLPLFELSLALRRFGINVLQ